MYNLVQKKIKMEQMKTTKKKKKKKSKVQPSKEFREHLPFFSCRLLYQMLCSFEFVYDKGIGRIDIQRLQEEGFCFLDVMWAFSEWFYETAQEKRERNTFTSYSREPTRASPIRHKALTSFESKVRANRAEETALWNALKFKKQRDRLL